MARKRSPNYPAISLPVAIERIKKIHEAEHQNSAERGVMAQHLGYGGLNGASLKLLSALTKYGLLEKTGDGELQVSDRAIDILFPEGDQRRLAIEAAAHAPALFAELREKWPNHLPSDEALRAHLIRRQFANPAIHDVTQTFRETFDLVARESGQYNTDSDKRPDASEPPMQQPQTVTDPPPPPPPPARGAPFRVSFEGGALEVSGHLTTPADVDNLVKFLQLNKIMITPIDEPMATEYADDEEGRAAEERGKRREAGDGE